MTYVPLSSDSHAYDIFQLKNNESIACQIKALEQLNELQRYGQILKVMIVGS